MKESSNRMPWILAGLGCVLLLIGGLCAGVLVLGGVVGGAGFWFAADQAQDEAAAEAGAQSFARSNAALVAATGAILAVSVTSTNVVLDEAEVELKVDGGQATASVTVYLRQQDGVWTAVGIKADEPGLSFSEGEILEISSGGDVDWD